MIHVRFDFDEIWLVDFEFQQPPGGLPKPICLVAKELRSGRLIRVWEDELLQMKVPPYSIGAKALFVGFYLIAEMGCHLTLGWAMPKNLVDLHVEFRNGTNGLTLPAGTSLLGALAYLGLPGIESAEKESMRDLAMRGGPWTMEEKKVLLDYCQSDVEANERLFLKMEDSFDYPRALLRGRYMAASAGIERVGVPIDTEALGVLKENWEAIQEKLIQRLDAEFQVFDGRTFKADRWATYCARHNIPWPIHPSGTLKLDDDTFRKMCRAHPEINPIRELRFALSQLRLSDLTVGSDGRNRTMLSPFRSKTGRNQPSNSKGIFGPSVWLRGLICPPEGFGIAYVDWSQQEFGIAAALSGDTAMMEAYTSGDPYLMLGKLARVIPPDGTKQTHAAERELFKAVTLAVQYGMGPESLAFRIGKPVIVARDLLRMHREAYKTFWAWSDTSLDRAMLSGVIRTVFGWTLHIDDKTNPRTIRNFPMQSNGAEMLRLACCFMVESGIRLCWPIHDAVLVEAPLDQLDETVERAQKLMSDASAAVLGGFRLRSDAKIVRYPDRYSDPRGEKMWATVWGLIQELRGTQPVRSCTGGCALVHGTRAAAHTCYMSFFYLLVFLLKNLWTA